VGFEADAGRFEGATALLGALARHEVDTSSLSLVHGVYPDALEAYASTLAGPSVFVSTNVTSNLFRLEDILQSLTHFDHAIVDLSRFGEIRDPTSQRTLIARLMELGFSEVVGVYSSGDTDVRHFQNLARAGMVAETKGPR